MMKGTLSALFSIAAIGLACTSCSDGGAASQTLIGPADQLSVCKAAVASFMGDISPQQMNGRSVDGLHWVNYNRPSDGTLWEYKCRIDADQAYWASSTGELGKSNTDFKYFYDIVGGRVHIKMVGMGGSIDDYSYLLASD